jgi:hypothetical protein
MARFTITILVATCFLLGLLLKGRSLAVAAVTLAGFGAFYFATLGSSEERWYGLLLAFPIYAAYGAISAVVGVLVRSMTEGKSTLRLGAVAAALIASALQVGMKLSSDESDAAWIGLATQSAQAVALNSEAVRATVGTVEQVTFFGAAIPAGGPLPRISFRYYIEGTGGKVQVDVKVTGKREQPTYSIGSIEEAK